MKNCLCQVRFVYPAVVASLDNVIVIFCLFTCTTVNIILHKVWMVTPCFKVVYLQSDR